MKDGIMYAAHFENPSDGRYQEYLDFSDNTPYELQRVCEDQISQYLEVLCQGQL